MCVSLSLINVNDDMIWLQIDSKEIEEKKELKIKEKEKETK